jgi:aldehyde dehydrogenase (NAD+)
MSNFKNFIAGQWVEPSTGAYFENRNPADVRDLVGCFPRSSTADVDAAVASARRGFDEWRRTPAPARGDVLRRIGDLMSDRKEEIADLMTREMGKPLTETRGDVQEGIDTAYYAAVEGRRLFGHTVPSELRNKWAMTYRRPIGVCGIITPFNFPLAIPTWKMFPALVCGNACVFKPARTCRTPGTCSSRSCSRPGSRPRSSSSCTARARWARPSSRTRAWRRCRSRAARRRARSSARRAAARTSALARDGRQERADRARRRRPRPRARGVLWGAFGTTGQRCTATSRLVLQRGIHDEFVGRLAERAERLVLGDGRQPGIDVGPLIHEESRAKVERYVGIGREEGATLVTGGDRPEGDGLGNGHFFRPTIFTGVKPGSRLEQEEIFGPVLSVVRVDSADEAFRVNNDVKYGLSSSLYTRDLSLAFRAMQDLDNGITYVNAPTIGAEAHLPFGGVKQTGNGHREGGWEVYEFYSETKVCYVDYSGTLQRAQIDNYLGTPD